MLRWPARARAAISALFRPLQDVEIYVEDSNDEAFYRLLLKRVLGEDLRIAKVQGLGGRTQVLNAAAEAQNALPAVYIIDGDLEWVRGDNPSRPESVFRLNAYCIENHLICEDAAATIVAHDTAVDESHAKQRIGFQNWLHSTATPLLELFAAFATQQKLSQTEPSISIGVGAFCTQASKGTQQVLSPTKVRKGVEDSLQKSSSAAGTEVAKAEFERVLSRIKRLKNSHSAVSGKTFLLPLLGFHLSQFGSKPTRRAQRMRLAAHCKLDPFDELRRFILTASSRTSRPR